jgi:hypothetical protein
MLSSPYERRLSRALSRVKALQKHKCSSLHLSVVEVVRAAVHCTASAYKASNERHKYLHTQYVQKRRSYSIATNCFKYTLIIIKCCPSSATTVLKSAVYTSARAISKRDKLTEPHLAVSIQHYRKLPVVRQYLWAGCLCVSSKSVGSSSKAAPLYEAIERSLLPRYFSALL